VDQLLSEDLFVWHLLSEKLEVAALSKLDLRLLWEIAGTLLFLIIIKYKLNEYSEI
jgi:hypothetical protein